jgi:hypothetical protein
MAAADYYNSRNPENVPDGLKDRVSSKAGNFFWQAAQQS